MILSTMTREEEIDSLDLSDEHKDILKRSESTIEALARNYFDGGVLVHFNHPELRFIPISDCQRDRLDRVAANMFRRLVFEGCGEAVKDGGVRSIVDFFCDCAKNVITAACLMSPEELCYGPMMRSNKPDNYHAPDDGGVP